MIIVSKEDSNFAEQLGDLRHADWARILVLLTEAAKEEIRAAVGQLIGESFETDSPPPGKEK